MPYQTRRSIGTAPPPHYPNHRGNSDCSRRSNVTPNHTANQVLPWYTLTYPPDDFLHLTLVLLNNLDYTRVKITQGDSCISTSHTYIDIPEKLLPTWVCLVLLCQLTEYGFDLIF